MRANSNRLLIVGDPHLGSYQIRSRLDNLYETTLAKMQWVVDTANDDLSICAVVFTGDFFHTNNNSIDYLNNLISILRKCLVPMYTIYGNHCTYQASYDQIDNRQVQLLINTGVVRLLGDMNVDNLGSVLRGYSAYADLDFSSPENVVGVVCHHWVGTPPYDDKLYVYPRFLKEKFPNLRFIIAGHDHSFHGDKIEQGIKIVRPGSLVRVSSAVENNRVPNICFLNLNTLDTQYIPVGVAESYEDIFDLERKRVHQDRKNSIESFADILTENVSISVDVDEIIKSQFDKVTDVVYKEYIKQNLQKNGFVV